MMKMKLFLVAFTVSTGLASVQPNKEIAIDQTGIQKNIRNLFDSIRTNNLEKTENYRKFLGQEAVRARKAFDTAKEELELTRQRNAQKQKNLYSQSAGEEIAAFKRETRESSNTCSAAGEQLYTFPERKNGSAIEAVLDLLQTQSRHVKELDRLFHVICEKNANHNRSVALNRSIDTQIEMADELIRDSIKLIEETVKNGSVTDYFKKKPLTYKTSWLLLGCYNYVDDFSNYYVSDNKFDGSAECDEMRKPLDLVVRGMKEYQKYLESVYEETGIYRDDETGFQYQKHPELYTKKETPK